MTPPNGQSRVAVIGAGISGLACARAVADRGISVTVFDKGRRPGGRMSTREAEGGLAFDHGCQYFTARDPRFQHDVVAWCQMGVVSIWEGRICQFSSGVMSPEQTSTSRYVGVPDMNAVCRHLGAALTVCSGVRVEKLTRTGRSWRIADNDGVELGEFERVVVALPPAQASELLIEVPPLAAISEAVPMLPCWAVMAAFNRPVDVPIDGAFIRNSDLSWIARNSSKLRRNGASDCWVLQGSADWSEQNLEEQSEEVERRLLKAFFEAVGVTPSPPLYLSSHRWRYAKSPQPLEEGCLWDANAGVAVCGDWCLGNRVEGAFLSGISAAEKLVEMSR